MEIATANGMAMSADLIALAAAGDAAAFTRIVAQHHQDLLRVCRSISGDAAASEEAVQAAWAIAWRRLPSLRDPSRLRAWLISIAANQARDALRHARRHRVVELAVGDRESANDPAVRSGDIDLRNALASLDPTDRALVALRYVSGFDSFELARALGMSAPGIRARLAHILHRLRSELGDD